MTEHTPTPWNVNGSAIWAADKSGYVAELSSPRGKDQRDIDAAFIVEAVNNHDALEKVRMIAEDVVWFDWSGNDPDAVHAIEQLRLAINAVVGGSHD